MPRFLLREWLPIGTRERLLLGHYWDRFSGTMRIRQRGENFFCNCPDLFTVRGLAEGDDAIERIFFKRLDDDASIAHRKLLAGGNLTPDERVHFIRLLLSLDARRPAAVDYVRTQSAAYIGEHLNADPEIRQMLDKAGVTKSAVEALEDQEGFSLADQAMELVQELTMNERVGQALYRGVWGLYHVQPGTDDFALGDRPLIRIKGLMSSQNIWFLPISPKALWFCAMSEATFASIHTIPPRKFVAWVNECAAMTSDKYVFCQRTPTTGWLAKRLKKRSEILSRTPSGEPFGVPVPTR